MDAPEPVPEPDGRGPAETGGDAVAAAYRAALVRAMEDDGAFDGDPGWREAFATVPRELFVPYYYVGSAGGYERLWDEDPDPVRRDRWLRGVYADAPLATRVRDGELLSSSSQPSLMARMLVALDVRGGEGVLDVLEIGAGPGYDAALLAHRLGDPHVTTVDLDPEITEAARRHLAAAGRHPAVVTGDGARGCPARAPYDRIIATCALPGIPPDWLAQCRPGARILAPLATGLLLLTVHDPEHAEGRFLHTPAYFVPLRGGSSRAAEQPREYDGLPRRALREDSFRFLLALAGDGLDPHEALALWRRGDRPGRERYGVTVTGGRARAWLDDPAGPDTWPMV
ncbi:methyltransferase domain-containing protein [Streptomyces triticagri]|uniref:Protein-L-isoaspartate O-methyltransferase n=1 Tax=Streptomyces triticagri TaxID=2293568 RepID=A0A372MBI7_9ACTN|nr:methyltransferase domain-containing protein [Streptomyces triticagri]RFU88276.1 methyltransferase domain-containing protein [Streptomyces triticagri]